MRFAMYDSHGRLVVTGSGSPVDAPYVVMALDGTLTQERVLTGSASLLITDGGANNPVTLSVIDNSSIQKVEVVKNSGAVVGTRKQLNFIEGVGITLTIADDGGNDQVDITIDAAAAVGYTTIEDEGVAIVQRSTMNFVGAGINAADVGAKSQITLDADLNTIAGLVVARGAIMTGSAAPAWQILSLGTAGKILRSDGTDLLYSTATFANTYGASEVLYSNGANAVQGLTTANYAILNTGATGIPSITATPLISTSLEIGLALTATGILKLSGTTSGTVSVTTKAAAGTWTFTLPDNDGNASDILQTDGAGVTSWVAGTSLVHDILSLTHSDTLAAAVARGAIIVGNATPKWARVTAGFAGSFVQTDGTDTTFSTVIMPLTTTINRILFSSAANNIGEVGAVNTAALVSSNVGVPGMTSGAVANRLLRTDGTTITFAQVVLTTDVTGVLPVANGGTGADNTTQTYTPALTNVTNVAASTAYQCQYFRVGNVVTVSGKVDIDPTAPASATELGIALPIASNFGNEYECGGVAAAKAVAGYSAGIGADAANNRAALGFTTAGDKNNRTWNFTFTYLVI